MQNEDDYDALMQNTELLYDNLGDLDIDTLEYLIYVCSIIIESKAWQQGE